MSGRPPCNACGYPFRADWIPLQSSGATGEKRLSYLCPRCAMGQGGASLARGCSLRSQYRNARAAGGLEGAPQQQRRLDQLRNYLRQHESTLRVVAVGAGLRGLSQALGRAARIRVLDPDADPQDEPSSIPESLETWSIKYKESVDLVVDSHLLDHLHDPRAHLKAVARCLRSEGKARIEVGNLCDWSRAKQRKHWHSRRAQLFSPHCLATICSHAGLAPIEIDIGESVVMVCRKARPQEAARIFAGPDARLIASRLRTQEPPRAPIPRRVAHSRPAMVLN